MAPPRSLSDDVERQVVRVYLAEGYKRAAELFGITRGLVDCALKRAGVKRAPRGSLPLYHFNEHAFDVLSEAALYWAGMYLADGSIHYQHLASGNLAVSPRVKLALAGDDGKHLEALRTFLSATHPLLTSPAPCRAGVRRGNKLTQLCITSLALATSLARFGITPRKSHTAAPPAALCLNAPFLRGVMDGDGWISSTEWQGRRYAYAGVVGSRATCELFRAFILTLSPLCKGTVRPHSSIWQYRVSGRTALDLLRVLYADATVALPRKLRLAQQMIRECNPDNGRLP